MFFLLQVLPAVPPVEVTFSEIENPWYAEPDVWVAIGTIALALITGVLAFYTYRLFAAARDARADSLEAIRVSKESMERNLRAYVVLSEVKSTFPVGTGRIPINFELVFTNTGQSPAVDSLIVCDLGISVAEETQLPPSYSNILSAQRVKGVIGRDQSIMLGFREGRFHRGDFDSRLTLVRPASESHCLSTPWSALGRRIKRIFRTFR